MISMKIPISILLTVFTGCLVQAVNASVGHDDGSFMKNSAESLAFDRSIDWRGSTDRAEKNASLISGTTTVSRANKMTKVSDSEGETGASNDEPMESMEAVAAVESVEPADPVESMEVDEASGSPEILKPIDSDFGDNMEADLSSEEPSDDESDTDEIEESSEFTELDGSEYDEFEPNESLAPSMEASLESGSGRWTSSSSSTASKSGQELSGSIRAKRNKKNKKNQKKTKKKIRTKAKIPKSLIYCSSPNKLFLFKNRKYLGSIYSWNRYIHRSICLKRGDVVFVRVTPRGGLKYGGYGAICSIGIPYRTRKRVRVRIRRRYRVRQRIEWKGKGKAGKKWKTDRNGKKYRFRWINKYKYKYGWRYRYSYRYRYFSTGASKTWKIRKGYKFGRGKERLRRLMNVCKDRKRWNRCANVKVRRQCRSYPYKRVGGRYVWAAERKKEWKRGWKKGHDVYMRFVYGKVKCNGGKPSRPGRPNRPNKPGRPGRPNRPNKPGRPGRPNKPNKPGRPGRPNKPWKPDEYCECKAVKPTMSYCYHWTDEKNKLCDSRPCGQKYECIGPAKQGRMNCISRRVKYVIVPKYFGARKCKYEMAKGEVRHIVPYDFPEAS